MICIIKIHSLHNKRLSYNRNNLFATYNLGKLHVLTQNIIHKAIIVRATLDGIMKIPS